MKIAIVGYGRMGREIERAAQNLGHEVVRKIDATADDADAREVHADTLSAATHVIEFAAPNGIADRMKVYGNAGVPVVIGTTGMEGGVPALKDMASSSGTNCLWGSNFSTGANMLFRLSALLSSWTNLLPEYDIAVHEEHHRQKLDSPSGTARTIAEAIIEASERKTTILTEYPQRALADSELHVSSTRHGQVAGLHRVSLDSLADQIKVEHIAKSRAGFAVGAVRAAQWLTGRSGFHTAQDFFNDILPMSL